ncbi:MAG: RDD family protein [Planctomycetaceae bacterium]|nr:RDD family protein [Planctomycetaceae bacterium]
MLRVPDDAAGKNAKCPQCGAVVPVPTANAAFPTINVEPTSAFPQAPPLPPSTPVGGNPFGAYVAPSTDNPFQAPAIDVGSPFTRAGLPSSWHPADLGSRFVGAMIDGLLNLGAAMPAMIMVFLAIANERNGGIDDASFMVGFYGLLIFGMLVLGAFQWYYIVRDGQTLGKKLAGTRIILLSGELPGFGAGVALRAWVPMVIGFVPCIGPLFNLINLIMIFPDPHRMLHDMIAGTIVVNASYDPRVRNVTF